jgi:S-adenosylmethionine/arginine decarboxylase-like enzyme
MIDGTYGKPITAEVIEDLFTDVIALSGMTAITPREIAWQGAPCRGWHGFQLLAESHVTFHAHEDIRYCFLDLFSCKEFDTRSVKELVVDRLGLTEERVRVVKRQGIDGSAEAEVPLEWPESEVWALDHTKGRLGVSEGHLEERVL